MMEECVVDMFLGGWIAYQSGGPLDPRISCRIGAELESCCGSPFFDEVSINPWNKRLNLKNSAWTRWRRKAGIAESFSMIGAIDAAFVALESRSPGMPKACVDAYVHHQSGFEPGSPVSHLWWGWKINQPTDSLSYVRNVVASVLKFLPQGIVGAGFLHCTSNFSLLTSRAPYVAEIASAVALSDVYAGETARPRVELFSGRTGDTFDGRPFYLFWCNVISVHSFRSREIISACTEVFDAEAAEAALEGRDLESSPLIEQVDVAAEWWLICLSQDPLDMIRPAEIVQSRAAKIRLALENRGLIHPGLSVS